MFTSFFPSPRAFFTSAAVWGLVAVLAWFFFFKEFGAKIGLPAPPEGAAPIIGVESFWSAPFIWFYIYFAMVVLLFGLAWRVISQHPFFGWSVWGSALIVFVTYFQVQVSVAINAWYGPFYDLIQASVSKSRPTPASEFVSSLFIFMGIAVVAVVVGTLTRFFVSHYNFRWRAAMNAYYASHWQTVRGVEGAAQRVQDDTMRFAATMEGLGTSFLDAIMTLIAFLPVLHGLEHYVQELPIIGAVPYPLVTAAIVWSIFGTGFLASIGIKLPGLEFKNQRVEAAYRKELVYGEDDATRAQPETLAEFFRNVRKNYFTLYFHYLYFNLGRIFYLQLDNIFPILILIPTLVAQKIALGPMQQVQNSFDQVRSSFQLLIHSWPTIISLISIFKRLRALEAVIEGKVIDKIEQTVDAV